MDDDATVDLADADHTRFRNTEQRRQFCVVADGLATELK
jgi:hypothetical protein